MKFDLLHEKPKLDIPTLNWVWDELWRRNHAARAKNIDERIRQDERAALMGRLLDMAEDEAGAAYREKGIPYAPAHYDGAGDCLTCGRHFSACPGVHTLEEIQNAARTEAQIAAMPLPDTLCHKLDPVTEFTFPTEETAREAWTYLDKLGRQGNNQATVAHRDGLRVYLRPEFTSPRLMKELAELGHCATLESRRVGDQIDATAQE